MGFMARKVILDVDPGIDDAVAITMALFDERLDVEAITAVAGNVGAEQASRNVQAIIEQLDPPRWPRIGVASDPDTPPSTDSRQINGADGLGNANFQVAELHHRHPSEKLIAEVVRSSPDPVTLIAMGPLTNVARAFQRDPELPTLLGELVIMGGTLSGIGNATPAAEFNIFCDPLAARAVLRSASTITLIPLDITNQVLAGYDFLDQLPADTTRAGRFLRKIVPHAFRTHHQELGLEGIHLHDAVALVSVLHPELFSREAMACDVEIAGELTTGATVFDRRAPAPKWRRNVNVATTVDAAAVKDCILRCLMNAARHG